MKLLVLVVGAGGQLGEAMAERSSAPSTRSSRSRAHDLDVADGRRRRATPSRSICPDVDRQLRGLHRTSTAPSSDPLAALAANAWARAHARARGRARSTPRSSTSARTSSSTAPTDRPYTEDDAPNPRGTYAMSKLLGEWFAADAPRHYVLRVESLFGGPHAQSSVDRILDGIARRHARCARSPIAPSRRATSTTSSPRPRRCSTGRAPSGLYHCVNTGWTTWAGLARELARHRRPPGRADRRRADGRRRPARAAPEIRGARRTTSSPPPASRCRPGRTRSQRHVTGNPDRSAD